MSIHPIMTNEEIKLIIWAITDLCLKHSEYSKDYIYDEHSNEFNHKLLSANQDNIVEYWIDKSLD